MMTARHSAILAAIVCGTTASADVTAQQVWENWTEQMNIYGQGFSVASETMSGNTLTIGGIQIKMTDPEAAILADIGTITLTENDDGTVSIETPNSYPITINATPPNNAPSTIVLMVRQSGMSLQVSGEPDAMNYDVAADSYSISLDSIEGMANTELNVDAAMITLLDIAGQYSVSQDTLTRIAYDMAIGALDVDLDFATRDGSAAGTVFADAADFTARASVATPIGMDFQALDTDMPPFNDGLSFAGGYSFGDLRYVFDMNVDGAPIVGSAIAAGGLLDASFDKDGVVYKGETRGLDMMLEPSADMPFPIEISLEKSGFDMRIPLSRSLDDSPRDARIALNVTNLSVSDALWNLADPGAILPRDPITMSIGIDALVTPFFDFLDPEQQQAMAMVEIPGELNSATITDFTIRAAGAEILGDGSFTFDNGDMQTFAGFPRPEGKATFAINGLNGLVDKLIQMGLIPAEEAMMPRMMLGMFATPVGDDMLTSTIEVNGEGHVLANGQRLR